MLLLNPNVRFMKGLGVRVEPMISWWDSHFPLSVISALKLWRSQMQEVKILWDIFKKKGQNEWKCKITDKQLIIRQFNSSTPKADIGIFTFSLISKCDKLTQIIIAVYMHYARNI